MALSTKQRNALPRSAFLDPKNRRFPVPTQAQARKAGISEGQRVRTLRNALSRSNQRQARGVKKVSPASVRKKVRSRGAGKVASVKKSSARSGSRSHRRTRRRH